MVTADKHIEIIPCKTKPHHNGLFRWRCIKRYHCSSGGAWKVAAMDFRLGYAAFCCNLFGKQINKTLVRKPSV